MAIDVHQQGWTEPLSEPKLRNDIYYSMSFNFEERMTLIVAVLRVSGLILFANAMLTNIDIQTHL